MTERGSSRGRGSGGRVHDDSTPGSASEDTGAGPAKRHPESLQHHARDIVYRLLAVRARSHAELIQALLRKGIDGEVAENVVQKFVDAGLVDDTLFAESWVEERHRRQGLGRRALGHELHRKGVADHVIAEALSTVGEESESERARELVRRKLRAMAVSDPTARLRRLVGMLARKGYSESLAFRVVREELERSGVDGSEIEDQTP